MEQLKEILSRVAEVEEDVKEALEADETTSEEIARLREQVRAAGGVKLSLEARITQLEARMSLVEAGAVRVRERSDHASRTAQETRHEVETTMAAMMARQREVDEARARDAADAKRQAEETERKRERGNAAAVTRNNELVDAVNDNRAATHELKQTVRTMVARLNDVRPSRARSAGLVLGALALNVVVTGLVFYALLARELGREIEQQGHTAAHAVVDAGVGGRDSAP